MSKQESSLIITDYHKVSNEKIKVLPHQKNSSLNNPWNILPRKINLHYWKHMTLQKRLKS